jgi:hypothetical protein
MPERRSALFQKDWTPSQAWAKDAIRLKLDDGLSWAALPDKLRKMFPRERFTVEMIRAAVRASERYKALHDNKIVFQDKKQPTEADVAEYFETLKNLNDAVMRLEKKQTRATITISEEKPFGIAFWGDWHTGCKGADHRQLDEDADTIADTDGLYAFGMGDYKDNASALVHPQSTHDSIATTDLQDEVVLHVWRKVKGKTPVIIRGCHEDWDEKNANEDFVQKLCDATGAVNLWHGGIVTIQCGSQEYKIAARHKRKYESSINTTNAQRNYMNEVEPCDMYMLAHRHYYDLQQTKRAGRDVIYGRSGSYKYYDEHGQKIAGYEGIYGVPVVICFPDRKEMIPVRSLSTAVTMLKSLRG